MLTGPARPRRAAGTRRGARVRRGAPLGAGSPVMPCRSGGGTGLPPPHAAPHTQDLATEGPSHLPGEQQCSGEPVSPQRSCSSTHTSWKLSVLHSGSLTSPWCWALADLETLSLRCRSNASYNGSRGSSASWHWEPRVSLQWDGDGRCEQWAELAPFFSDSRLENSALGNYIISTDTLQLAKARRTFRAVLTREYSGGKMSL
ncbi:uncharacterized protein LOC129736832 [Falco cherrug]|uniref:uncharacterized protein LOC129736832 n=1 Tax=Falco cherrug TaxID=345164 RepID=UPI0024785C73|nr:uncharacterized protein LOC129736832 [Falco cherrug]